MWQINEFMMPIFLATCRWHVTQAVRFATWLNGFRFTITSSINIPTRRACCVDGEKLSNVLKWPVDLTSEFVFQSRFERLPVGFSLSLHGDKLRIGSNKDQLSEKVQTTMLTSFHHVELLNIWMREILLNHMLWTERNIESRSNLRNVSWLP